GLFLVTKENTKESWIFHHGRVGKAQVEDSNAPKNLKRSTTHREDLSIELKRLHENPLQTITKTFLDFINKNNRLSIFSFNCQSLCEHVNDLEIDALVKKINVLILSETHMGNDEKIDIPNFNFVASFRRNNRPAGRIVIYQNTDTVHYCTNYMDVHAKYVTMFNTSTFDIGDDKNLPLLEFFKNIFGLNMSNDRNLSTRYKTTIDAVFTRYLNKFESKLFVLYFSYHKPIVSVLEICDDAGSDDGARVGEIMDGN
ncbi:Uncharacterized protein FWK35_00037850, partial [Aphis craccivora]